jgi:predicted GNAT family acetyltransferase
MKIEQFDRETKGFFKASDNGSEAGVMTYSHAGEDKIIIDHTEVDPAFSGKGVGKQLLMALVAYARKEKIKVLPLCPFARSVFDKVQEIRDVLV